MTSTVPSVARVDGPEKASGRARYAVEHPLPGAAWAWPVTATVPAGRVADVDPEPALALPGVLAVLTPDNVSRLDPAGQISPAHGAAVPDLMVLQDHRIAFRGQIVAAVVAETLEQAQEGATRVRVTEEPDAAPALTFAADDPAAVVVEMTNDLSPGQVSRGDADTAFAAAEVQVDETYGTAGQFAMPMEPHAAAATWDGDRLTIYCSDQGPSWTATTLASLLGVPVDDVEVVAEYVGGGFGSKAAPRPPIMLAALAARHVGRPVKVALDRPQSVDLTTYRSPSRQRLRLGASRDGDITALIHEATGQTSRLVTYADQTVTPSRLLYDVPDCRTTTSAVPLDVSTPGWVRAPGEAPGMFALESAVDELAGQLGIDPVELRVRNEPAVDPATGHPFSSRRLVECLRAGAERFGWAQRTGPDRVRRTGRWLHGVGVASAVYPVMTFPATATASIGSSGPAVVEIGAADIGTGARTVLHQLAAEALDVSMDEVELRIGRSSLPEAPFAGGSMGTGSWGWAIQGACEELTKAIAAAGGCRPPGGVVGPLRHHRGHRRHGCLLAAQLRCPLRAGPGRPGHRRGAGRPRARDVRRRTHHQPGDCALADRRCDDHGAGHGPDGGRRSRSPLRWLDHPGSGRLPRTGTRRHRRVRGRLPSRAGRPDRSGRGQGGRGDRHRRGHRRHHQRHPPRDRDPGPRPARHPRQAPARSARCAALTVTREPIGEPSWSLP